MKTVHVAAAVICSGDKILATQRGYGDWKDYWEFPGGKIEPGETPEEAIRREILEELDTEITVGEKLTTIEYDYPAFHLILECFLARVSKGGLVLKEHEAAKWLHKDELDSVNWLPADRLVLPFLKRPDPVKQVSAVILAGGRGSRMGRNKAELEFFGVSFLKHQVNKLRALGVGDIIISGSRAVPEGCRAVDDVYPHRGPLSGLHAGLLAVRERAALVLAVDTPLLPQQLLRELIESHQSGITLVSFRGEIEPLIGVYDKSLAEMCEKLLQGENTSLRKLIRDVGMTAVEYTGDPLLLMNCNTPEEYEKILDIESGRRRDG